MAKNPEMVTLAVQMTAEEREQVKRAAQAVGMNPSGYVRWALVALEQAQAEDMRGFNESVQELMAAVSAK